jgi:hypothetical protein
VKRAAASPSTGFNREDLLSSVITPCRQDLTRDGSGIFNAESQGREGAKSFLRLGVFASWRLGVKKSLLSVKSAPSAVHFLWLRLRWALRFETFCGNSIQVPFHEQFTLQIGPFPIKVNQA